MDERTKGLNEPVEITLPLSGPYAPTLRVVAASLGADSGFSIDEIDDVRLAISELFAVFAEAAPGGRVTVTFDFAESSMHVSMGGVAGVDELRLDDLSRTILHSSVDDFHMEGGHLSFGKFVRDATARNG